jgi:hypothetical protein
MKFFKGQENARVYCKEVKTQGKTTVIVAAEVLDRKKTDQADTQGNQHYTPGSKL